MKNSTNRGNAVDIRDFENHLIHLTNGKWADNYCRVCKLKLITTQGSLLARTQYDTPPGKNTIYKGN